MYAALLETPRGQYLEANVGDPSTTRIVAYLKATTLPVGALEAPLYVPQSAGAAGQSDPTRIPPLGTGLDCMPAGIRGNDLSTRNKITVLNCLIFSTSHQFWRDRSRETIDDNAFTRDDRWKDVEWLNYGDWQCSGLVGQELNGPVPSCLKHDVGYGTKRIAGTQPDPGWNTELDGAWNPRNKALADFKLKADIEKYGCENASLAALVVCAAFTKSEIATAYHWWLADVAHIGWPITQADRDHIESNYQFVLSSCGNHVPTLSNIELTRKASGVFIATWNNETGCVPGIVIDKINLCLTTYYQGEITLRRYCAYGLAGSATSYDFRPYLSPEAGTALLEAELVPRNVEHGSRHYSHRWNIIVTVEGQ